MVKWFLLALVALVTAEVAAFLAVGSVLGPWQALLLMFTISLFGIVLLQYPGRARIGRLHDAVAKGGLGGLEAGGDAFLTVAAGVLLLLPGFVTDAAGLLLLLPPVRAWIGGRFHRFVQTHPPGPPGVVDLKRKEWNRVPERRIEEPKRPNDAP